jgi:transcriptional regulator with XRE-family HTH domain
MEKKVTAKDVAREAGVSVATVSYVLNNKEGQKISEATRKKILQVANLLHYTPSHEAKSLATGKNNLIGITYHLREDSPSRNLEIMHMVNLLVERFSRMKYGCLIIPFDREDASKAPNRMLDGIIAIDIPEADFKAMADNYFVPIICVDMVVNDFLFYQIYTDIRRISDEAEEYFGSDYYLVTDRYDNEGFQKHLCSCVPADRVIDFSSCDTAALHSLRDKKVLVNGSYLALIMSRYVAPENLAVFTYQTDPHVLSGELRQIHNDLDKKANLVMNIMLNAFERKFDITHDFRI